MSNQPQAPDMAPQQRISGKVRVAIDAMVWQARNRRDAAEAAGLQDDSLYRAMTKPEVKAYYQRQLEVLRTSEKARNIHALVEVRDQQLNQMARVNAVKALELLDETAGDRGTPQRATPGVVIVIQSGQTTVGADPVLTQIEASDDLPYGHSDILDEGT